MNTEPGSSTPDVLTPGKKAPSIVGAEVDSPLTVAAQPASQSAEANLTLEQALQFVTARANAGSQEALDELRMFLDKHPNFSRLLGDVGGRAERAWITLISGGDKFIEESTLRRFREFKAGLAGTDATPLELAVIDLIGVCYLAVEEGERSAATLPDGASLQQAMFRAKRAECAGRRFANAVRALAVVRRLLPRHPIVPAPAAPK